MQMSTGKNKGRSKDNPIVNLASNVPRQAKLNARWLYFSGMTEEQIAYALELDEEVVKYWTVGLDGKRLRKECWYNERKASDDSVVLQWRADKYQALDNIGSLANRALLKGLEKLNKDIDAGDKELSVPEMKVLSEILTNMDKIARLEKGQATDIIQTVKGLTADEARKILESDPMAVGIIPAEAKEL